MYPEQLTFTRNEETVYIRFSREHGHNAIITFVKIDQKRVECECPRHSHSTWNVNVRGHSHSTFFGPPADIGMWNVNVRGMQMSGHRPVLFVAVDVALFVVGATASCVVQCMAIGRLGHMAAQSMHSASLLRKSVPSREW